MISSNLGFLAHFVTFTRKHTSWRVITQTLVFPRMLCLFRDISSPFSEFLAKISKFFCSHLRRSQELGFPWHGTRAETMRFLVCGSPAFVFRVFCAFSVYSRVFYRATCAGSQNFCQFALWRT